MIDITKNENFRGEFVSLKMDDFPNYLLDLKTSF